MMLPRAFLTLLAFSVLASAATYTIDLKPDNTKILWTLGDVLHIVHGTFRVKSGTLSFDTATNRASGKVVADVESGDSGGGARDRRMHKEVLESAKYPEAIFAPDRFEGQLKLPGTSNLKIHGMFQIHGAEHEVLMEGRTVVSQTESTYTIKYDLPYVSWGLKDPSNFLLKVSKFVTLTIESKAPLVER